MTKEEAIEILCTAFDIWYSEYTYIEDWSKENEALDMAIDAINAMDEKQINKEVQNDQMFL